MNERPHNRPHLLVESGRQILSRLASRLRRAWLRHQRLLGDNPRYVAATASGAAAMAGQDSIADLLATAIAMLLAIYAATRGFTHHFH